jgi:hypothetical protein
MLLVGCGKGGPKTYPVSGKITLKDGAPLTNGIVQFQSAEYTGSGSVDANGNYTLSGTGEGDGVPAGTYKVLLLSTAIGGGYDKPDEPEKRVVHSKYESADTTDLTVKVGPDGSDSFDFSVDPYEGEFPGGSSS